jgi:mRNA interferase RelE/StbE
LRTSFRSSFLRDLKKVRDQAVLDRVRAVIEEAEAAEDLSAVSRIKKIKGAGDYRFP